ncbi:hypothetical protein [Ammoniphilus resinae]|uniref:Uncharacterized protein n=1 Tax=Ammoniphilus resinae TaxID=861532 RepID=A0ABS4GX77_9BACL|nr:hypothetical protein [Ammoniphilus resinae]MBP1934880.1 hypothetical protein [Ammoniphilus resinae]
MDGIKVEIGAKAIEKARKVRSDKRICVKTNLDHESHLLLHRLSMTVRKSKTALATEIVETMLRNPAFITYLMDKHKVPEEHRLIPVTNNGKITY